MIGGAGRHLDAADLHTYLADTLGRENLAGSSMCVVVPDGTRTCPLPEVLDVLARVFTDAHVKKVTVLVALGTHGAMQPGRLARHVGLGAGGAIDRLAPLDVINHAWWDPATFVTVGSIAAAHLHTLSEGRLNQDVPVRINRHVIDHDRTLIVGPVLPHEVVGFSGGNKYLFPGVSGPEMIDVSHWLGALIGSARIIGTRGVTPVRAFIDAAAALVPAEISALCLVTGEEDGLCAASYGEPKAAWAKAAEVSALTHVRYLDAPVSTVVSLIPKRYDDLWTGAKGFYKVEPVVADGGRVILVAPHINDITPMHPGFESIGYHVAEYFTGQWERFRDHPWGELAHSSHLRGAGSWDPIHGEQPRVQVTLASKVSRERTEAVGLEWVDPASIDLARYKDDPDVMIVPNAGEVLYRLQSDEVCTFQK